MMTARAMVFTPRGKRFFRCWDLRPWNELRSAYRLSPPSFEHRDREKRIEEKLRYHDGFSVKIRRIEQRIARKAKMAAGKITQEKKRDFKDEV
ncbi:TPA: hypothetical protein NVB94_004035 [Vibrio cholerae]|nr:hypothetical protein [Vibrio cholerae]HCJ6971528.1 hypothetical protein [Vibrio cholerae]HCJ6975120.1 hypothetical protein [Vibrio cholerae]HCJ6975382.1 hypothetical protein [Vibrio cholerae]